MDIALTALTWLLYSVLAIVGLALFLVNMPYSARLAAQWDADDLDARAWVGWPLRLLGVMVTASMETQEVAVYFLGVRLKRWTVRELRSRRKGATDEAPRKKRRPRSAKRKRRRHPMEALHFSRMPHKGYALQQLARWLFMDASLSGRFGLGDPYDAARIEMALLMARAVFPSLGRDIELDYLETVCEGRLNLSMMLFLPRVLIGALVFLVRREGREMVRHYLARPRPAETTV